MVIFDSYVSLPEGNPGDVRGISWVNPLLIRLAAYLLSGMIHQKKINIGFHQQRRGAADDRFISDSSCSCTIDSKNGSKNQSIWVKENL